MFSWFTGGGGEDNAKSTEAQAPGFHPITVPPTSTLANLCVAPAATASSSPVSPPPIHETPTPAFAPFAGNAAASSPAAASPQPPCEATFTNDAPAASSSLFDGMSLGKGRRRRQHMSLQVVNNATHAVRVANSEAVSSNGVAQPGEAPSSASSSSPEELRQRLENFYRLYSPAELASVESIVEAYQGQEAELFQKLVRRYGPEPVRLSAAHLHALPSAAAASSQQVGSAPSESDVSAFRFISPTAEAAVAAWAVPKTDDHDNNQSSCNQPVAFELQATDMDTATQSVPTAVQLSLSSSSPSSQEQDLTPGSEKRQQQQALSMALTPSPTVANSVTLLRKAEKVAFTASDASIPHDTSSISGEEEKETMDERHRRELRVSQGALLEARAALAYLLCEARDALRQRQEKITRIQAVERQIQDCVRTENYREADALSDDVARTAQEVKKCDEVWAGLGRHVSAAQQRLEEAVRQVASLLRAHEVELQAKEEKEQQQLQSQLNSDDTDLRLREETVQVCKENLTVKKSVAETRLGAAREEQAAIQTRLEATLGTGKAQQENLTRVVGQLDSQIEALKSQLRQLEEKRSAACAQLSKVEAMLQTAKAAHASELDAAAATVQDCEHEMQRVELQWADVESEQANIAAKRRELEAAATALLTELKERQDKRESVHQRIRALEQDTIPASDRYWRAWQDLLTKRLRGAYALFEVPSAGHPGEIAKYAPSSLTIKADLQKQLDALAGELNADEELKRDAERRLAACEARVAPLTAAKTAAVSNKNFKVAQQCANELKIVQLSSEGCKDDIDLYGGQVRALERTMERLRNELTAVEVQTQRESAAFKRDYGAMMAAFGAVAVRTPDYVQLPKENQGLDELAEAVRGLWDTLQQEWQCAQEDGNKAAAEAEAAKESSTIETTAKPLASLLSSSLQGDGAEVPSAAASKAGAAETKTTTTDDECASSAEVLKRRLAELQMQLEEAIAREAYGMCDVIQHEVVQLEAQLAFMAPPPTVEEGKLASSA